MLFFREINPLACKRIVILSRNLREGHWTDFKGKRIN